MTIYQTVLSAIKCVEGLDAGPIYLKRPLSLEGSAKDIFKRSSALTFEMIKEIIAKKPVPYPQQGQVVEFARRKPEEGNLAGLTDMTKIYDFIRMLDAEGYPHAYLENDLVKYEFTDAKRESDEILATVRIKRKS